VYSSSFGGAMTDVGGLGATGVVGVVGFAGVAGVVGFLSGITELITEVMALPASAAAAASVAAFVIASPFEDPLDALDDVGVVCVAVPDPEDVIGFADSAGTTTEVTGGVVVSVVVGTDRVVGIVGSGLAGSVGAVDPPEAGTVGFEITLVSLRLGFKNSVFRFFWRFVILTIFFFRSSRGWLL